MFSYVVGPESKLISHKLCLMQKGPGSVRFQTVSTANFKTAVSVSPVSGFSGFGFEPISKKSKKSRQGDHSNFEFLECCLKKADDPQGGGASPPPGDPCILSQPRNSKFE